MLAADKEQEPVVKGGVGGEVVVGGGVVSCLRFSALSARQVRVHVDHNMFRRNLEAQCCMAWSVVSSVAPLLFI